MYVPIMKNRKEELNVIKNMNSFFNNSMIPLIEIIKDSYNKVYKTDSRTGEPIYEIPKGKKRRRKIQLPPTEKDINTLELISNSLNNKVGFIDFFRFSEDEYDNKSFKDIELAFRLSRDYDYYKHRIQQIGDYENLIPVVSIKKGFQIPPHALKNLLRSLRTKNQTIAIRITSEFLEEYTDDLENMLTENDYLMLDIRNKRVESKFIEIEELQELDTDAKKILLNSPRPSNKTNGEFENLQYTKNINNNVASIYNDYGLDGFGDFGGLKDVLPEESGGNGMGAALGLIYIKEKNAFFSIVNEDTSKGVRGFKYVRFEILKRLSFIDADSSCLAIDRIKKMSDTYGNWGTWNNITLTRYIQQQSKK